MTRKRKQTIDFSRLINTKLIISIPLISLILMMALCTVLAKPVISSFVPTSGAIGSSVTIIGTGFNATPTQNVVFFGATRALVTAASATSLTVTVPMGATYQCLSVTNLAVNQTAYSTVPFIVTLAGSTNFEPKVDFATGTGPVSASIADIDGDGKPDLIVANKNSNTMSVFRNTSITGAMSFAPRVDFTTGWEPQSISIGDIDGDGKPDVAMANLKSQQVSVLRNTSTLGMISFATKVNFMAGYEPISVCIRDLDSDGKPDLAVTNNHFFTSSLGILRNTSTLGTVSFAARVDFATVAQPREVSIGDIDGNGKPDVVVANQGSNAVSVFRNTSTSGTISLAARVDFTAGLGSWAVSIGDIDGDGKSDLVVANRTANNVSVFRNTSTTGNVSFAAMVDFSTGTGPFSVTIGDIDGDGKPDLALANNYSYTVSVLRNTSTPGMLSFAPKVDYTSDINPNSVSIGDLDCDGKPDLAATTTYNSTVSIIRQSSPCAGPTLPTLSASTTTNCGSISTTLSIASGSLNNASSWQWYTGSCGTTPAGTGTSMTVSPATTTTYFARGEGGCITPGSCSSITVTVIKPAPVGLITSNITVSSAITKWDTVACAVGYKMQYRKQGVTAWTTVNINANAPTKTISGLLAATKYQWRVKSKFADGTFSVNSATANFTTAAIRSGLETIASNNELVVYPNPADDKLNLEFPFTEGVSTKITVVNTIGQTVLEQNVSDDMSTIQLNIQSLTKGIYMVTVKNGDNTFTARFIKE